MRAMDEENEATGEITLSFMYDKNKINEREAIALVDQALDAAAAGGDYYFEGLLCMSLVY